MWVRECIPQLELWRLLGNFWCGGQGCVAWLKDSLLSPWDTGKCFSWLQSPYGMILLTQAISAFLQRFHRTILHPHRLPNHYHFWNLTATQATTNWCVKCLLVLTLQTLEWKLTFLSRFLWEHFCWWKFPGMPCVGQLPALSCWT